MRSLVALVLGLIYLVGSSSAVQDCYEEDSLLADVRSLLGCRDCTIKNVDPLVWSGSSSIDNRGGGWAPFDMDVIHYNVPDALQNKYFSREANNKKDVVIQRNGIYKIHHTSQAYCNGNCGLWSRIMVNNACRDYWHWSNAVQIRTQQNSMYIALNANDKVHISIHGGGSDPYRYKKNNNHLQISYVGNKEEVVFFSGGCSGHVRVHHWKRLCLNHIDFKSVKTQGFLDHFSDGRVVVLKAGFYRLIGRAMIHGHHGDKQMALRVNGVNKAYAESNNHQWASVQTDITLALKEDDLVELFTKVVGNDPYTSHSHSVGSHHAELQIVRLGDLGDYDFTENSPANHALGAVKLLQGGPATVSRDNDWHVITMERVGVVSMGNSEAACAQNGDITINAEGWYRFHAVAQTYSDGEALHQGKLTVAGKIVQIAKNSNRAWQNLHLDYIFKAKAGDVLQAAFKVDGANPQIANFHTEDGQTFVELQKLEW